MSTGVIALRNCVGRVWMLRLTFAPALDRVLFNTLLNGADDVEQELVDTESPYAGSRKFGMCFTTGRGTMASVGTLLEIERHERLQDGRMLVVSKGSEASNPCEAGVPPGAAATRLGALHHQRGQLRPEQG